MNKFDEILADFHKHGILQDFILIGSWVLRIYRVHFGDDARVPIVRTVDIDFLVENPPKISKAVDMEAILEKHGLELLYSPIGGQGKFVSPDFEIEFLYPEKGRGEEGGKRIPDLGIVATPLRYMNFIESYSIPMQYKGLSVRVPEPAVFVLMKYLLVKKRKATQKHKIAKDIATAKELESFLLESGKEPAFQKYYSAMPKKWQKDLQKVLEEYDSALCGLFRN